ncbi:putative baseplate assembly protein [Paenibacillus athensensis]|uniref:Putative baseplate assembly protein n=1 Tax=Paenibacillus athensensis TaxID=1967502 RepID=A0A4Y8PR57_9BACL|nr:putative baseplate assembly protein [Paenibacillus athensensis]MCD1260497.1 putative baseplate assembly protein [Paenibacillus athensensis]
MLPLPNLDDRMFEQMMDDARKTIPKLFPQWTDENAHDPGITLLELMAWMTEIQQYYMNRITEQSERKFLKLLGVSPREATSAVCEVTFSEVGDQAVLPKGTPLVAHDLRFETVETLRLIPSMLQKVLVRSETGSADFTSNNRSGIPYYAFGPDGEQGASLYIGFDTPLPVMTEITLSIKLFEDYPVKVGRSADGTAPLISTAEVEWTFCADGQGLVWQPIDVVRDNSVQLSQSGDVVFKLASDMQKCIMYPADDQRRYWLCCTLKQDGYELPPKIEHICLNAVRAEERHSYSEIAVFDSSGKPDLSCVLSSHLAYTGKHTVQLRDSRGFWHDWKRVIKLSSADAEDTVFELEQHKADHTTHIRFGDGEYGSVPPKGKDSIRVISFAPEFEDQRWLGSSNGLPNQTFEVPKGQIYKRSTMMLQVGVYSVERETMVWEDWQSVEDFDNSLSTDLHYVYDMGAGLIRFGNNEEGAIPEKSALPNIRFIVLQSGGGVQGNIKDNMISGFADDALITAPAVTLTNPFPAHGGLEAESVEQAKLRVQHELNTPSRAVTAEDYEEIACGTPGLRVARVKAIPLYKPGMKDYPRVKAPAQMTVAVVPYGETDKPMAGRGFLETIRKHLDLHRLLSTELHVIPADYVCITVHAVVVVEPRYKDEESMILTELRRLLQPMGHADGTEGWPFGRTVYKGDIYGVISRLKGVVYVQDLWIDADGENYAKDSAGDIHIPPYALVYSGEHSIELISQADV